MPDPVVPPVTATEQSVQDILAKIFSSANWRGEVEKTVKRNSKLLSRVKELQSVVDRFSAHFNVETGAPKEGKLLTKEQAADYDAFVALGVKPADLKTVVEEHGKLKIQASERAEEEKYVEAAEALGFENVPALTRWLKREKLALEFKEQRVKDEESGKTVIQKLPFVRPAGDEKAVAEALDEYIEREVPEFVDVFKFRPAADDEEAGGGAETEEDDIVARASREATERVRSSKGVRIPATRAAGNGGRSRDTKKLEQIEAEARASQQYSL